MNRVSESSEVSLDTDESDDFPEACSEMESDALKGEY